MAGQSSLIKNRSKGDRPAAWINRIGASKGLHQALRRHSAEGLKGAVCGRINVKRHQKGQAAAPGIERAGRGDLLAAHGPGCVKKARRRRRRHQGGDFCAASGLSEHGHAARIAAESGRVRLHPLQGEDQIQLPGIAGVVGAAGPNHGQGQIPEGVEAVVQGDDDRVAEAGEARAVCQGIAAVAVRVGAAMDVNKDRPVCLCIQAWRPDIQEQAVF